MAKRIVVRADSKRKSRAQARARVLEIAEAAAGSGAPKTPFERMRALETAVLLLQERVERCEMHNGVQASTIEWLKCKTAVLR